MSERNLVEELDRHWCQVLLSCWGDSNDSGISPSGFETRLMELIAHADGRNRGKIALGYPEVVEVAEVWNHTKGGAAIVREVANRPYSQERDGNG